MSDYALRAACFARLAILSAAHGEEVPYIDGLDAGFPFGGNRVPFLARARGIHHASVQVGPAALSIQTSTTPPYDDEATEEGFYYSYQAGPIDNADNRALRSAFAQGVPLVYFVATRPWFYRPEYPVYITADDPVARRVLVTPGWMIGPVDERETVLIHDPIERRYAVRDTRVRLHQARFRGQILRAYSDRCTICRLKEPRLLEAAHIAGDLEAHGEPIVPNGLSLCSIHHQAYDTNLVGISPDYQVQVSTQLLDEEDGPMLELLKGFHTQDIELPTRRAWRPDRERLAERFERFRAAS